MNESSTTSTGETARRSSLAFGVACGKVVAAAWIVAIAAASTAGCGPSREVQYLQAAEEVKAEERILDDIEHDLKLAENSLREFKSIQQMQADLEHEQDILKIQKAGREPGFSDKSESLQSQILDDMTKRMRKREDERKPFHEKIEDLKSKFSQQRDRVAEARTRRDALSPQAVAEK